jgi:vacuolar protein sorting-associated protein 54
VGKFLLQLAEGKPVAQPAAEAEPKKSEETPPAETEKEKKTEGVNVS